MIKYFGERLKTARKLANCTQAELARRIGVSPHAVTMIETGRQGVRWKVLEKIVDALGQPASFYFSTDPPGSIDPSPARALEIIGKALSDMSKMTQELAESQGHSDPVNKPVKNSQGSK